MSGTQRKSIHGQIQEYHMNYGNYDNCTLCHLCLEFRQC